MRLQNNYIWKHTFPKEGILQMSTPKPKHVCIIILMCLSVLFCLFLFNLLFFFNNSLPDHSSSHLCFVIATFCYLPLLLVIVPCLLAFSLVLPFCSSMMFRSDMDDLALQCLFKHWRKLKNTVSKTTTNIRLPHQRKLRWFGGEDT